MGSNQAYSIITTRSRGSHNLFWEQCVPVPNHLLLGLTHFWRSITSTLLLGGPNFPHGSP